MCSSRSTVWVCCPLFLNSALLQRPVGVSKVSHEIQLLLARDNNTYLLCRRSEVRDNFVPCDDVGTEEFIGVRDCTQDENSSFCGTRAGKKQKSMVVWEMEQEYLSEGCSSLTQQVLQPRSQIIVLLILERKQKTGLRHHLRYITNFKFWLMPGSEYDLFSFLWWSSDQISVRLE